MTRWADEDYADAAFDVGLSCLELLTNQDRWVHRRVETIDVLRTELARRQVTTEFTLPSELHDFLRIGANGPWCVPLAVLRKRPLRNFDLRENGQPVPVLGQEHNGPVASELLKAAVHLASEPALPTLAPLIERVAKEPRLEARSALEGIVGRSSSRPEVADVLNDPTASYFLATLADNYLLVALLSHPEGRRIIKFAYDNPAESASRRFAETLGWTPFVVDFPVPAAKWGSSYHAELVVPEELCLDALIIDASSGSVLSTSVDEGVDRASLHVQEAGLEADPFLVAVLYAERSGTPTLAFATALVTSAALAVGAVWGNFDSVGSSSSTAVLLAGSALFAGTVARPGEHRLVSHVFLGARVTLVAVALCAVAAAASVAFGACGDTRSMVWSAAAIVSSLATISLAISYFRAKPFRRSQIPSD